MKHLVVFTVYTAILAVGFAGAAAESPARPASSAAPESCQLRNKKFRELLRPEDASSANGTRLVLYPAQPWKCMTWKMLPAGESAFQLQNHFTSKTFASAGKADATQAAVTQVPLSQEGSTRPVWRFTRLPDGLYQITEVKSGQALTAVSSEGGGARIVVAPWRKGDEQKWEMLKIDPGKLTM
jgi:hypothetical protein